MHDMAIDTSLTFGEQLRSFRKRRRFTQQALANKVGVHRNTVGTWECGNSLPDGPTFAELTRQLGLSRDEIRAFIDVALRFYHG